MDIFGFHDYKFFLRELIDNPSDLNREKITISKLAEAAGCQRSYLSKVLSSEVHLTPDHAFGIKNFLKLQPLEAEYFTVMVNYARAGAPVYKEHLKSELHRIRQHHLDISNRVDAKVVQMDKEISFYYTSWVWAAVHVATSIPGLQTVPHLSRRLGLSEIQVLSVLKQLESMGLVRSIKQRWEMTEQDIHLHSSSPVVSFHHQNWRQKAVVASQLNAGEGAHYTTVSSISKKDYEILKSELVKFISKMRKSISVSPEEELICVNLDVFKV